MRSLHVNLRDALPEASVGRSKRQVSESVKKIVAAEQKWACAHCQQLLPATYEVDHIKALYLGGTNERDNLQALCKLTSLAPLRLAPPSPVCGDVLHLTTIPQARTVTAQRLSKRSWRTERRKCRSSAWMCFERKSTCTSNPPNTVARARRCLWSNTCSPSFADGLRMKWSHGSQAWDTSPTMLGWLCFRRRCGAPCGRRQARRRRTPRGAPRCTRCACGAAPPRCSAASWRGSDCVPRRWCACARLQRGWRADRRARRRPVPRAATACRHRRTRRCLSSSGLMHKKLVVQTKAQFLARRRPLADPPLPVGLIVPLDQNDCRSK